MAQILETRSDAFSDASEMDGKYLTFWTDKQLFGVPIADVVQIVGMQEITRIPEFPGYAKGIINLRGSIIPVIDIRLRFGKHEIDYNERTCIIVTNIHERYFGFIVDEVDEVTGIEPEHISQPPLMRSGQGDQYLTGIAQQDRKIVLLLDAARILGSDELALLSGMADG